MAFTLDQIVPWGRTFDEYRRMFALTNADLARRILGCGDGPASFNAEATARGVRVLSIDPIYAFGRTELEQRFRSVRAEVLRQTELNRGEFVWDYFKSVEELGVRWCRSTTSSSAGEIRCCGSCGTRVAEGAELDGIRPRGVAE